MACSFNVSFCIMIRSRRPNHQNGDDWLRFSFSNNLTPPAFTGVIIPGSQKSKRLKIDVNLIHSDKQKLS